jgi:hypothetical protein
MRFTKAGGGPAGLAQACTVWRAALMGARGVLRKPWLGHASGPVFRGRNVTVMKGRCISHTGRLVLEDHIELQGVSQRAFRSALTCRSVEVR